MRRMCMLELVVMLLAATVMARAEQVGQADTKPAGVEFDSYDGYFVSNQFEPEKAQSFAVFKDQKTFEDVFKARRLQNDKAHRVPDDAFGSKMVVATVKRGKAIWTFKVTEVVVDGGVLTVRYTATAEKSDSAKYSCPMIVSVPKGDYKTVVFEEGGKVVGKVEMSGAATQK